MKRLVDYNDQQIEVESETREQTINQIYKPTTTKKKTKLGDYTK